MGTRWRRGIVLSAVMLAGAGGGLAAQVRGQVQGEDGAPIAGARIRLLGVAGTPAPVETDGSGRFLLPSPTGPALLVAAAIGFRPETLAVAAGTRAVAVRLEPARVALAAVTVTAAPRPGPVTRRSFDRAEIDRRRPASVQDVLRLTPGLLVVQHAGGGKAEQLFLRGFDADHGTDVALAVDGTPVNLVSHAHGQGYADLHFLLPEVVERLEVRKGPFDPADGDFATAGAVTLVTRDRVPAPALETRGGSFGTARVVGLLPVAGSAAAGGYLALAAQRTAGPFDADQRFRRLTGFGKWTAPAGGAVLVATASGYDARWHGSGQIPARAVAAGTVSRFGAIDSTEGGATRRLELSLALRPGDAGDAWGLRAYAVGSRLRLFSNFTFFARDSVEGDGIEQWDDRVLLGLDGRVFLPTPLGPADLGAGLRSDQADVGLFDQTARRRRGTRVRSDVSQQHLFLWARRPVRLGEGARLELGGRADLFRFAVGDRTPGGGGPAGERWLGRVSPKVAAALELGGGTTLHAGLGMGFHSNDARDVVSAGAGEPVLPRATSAELGLRRRWGGGEVAAAVWGLDLASELVFVGDEGVTEPSGATRRIGLDLEARMRLARWLWADADLSLARARFRDAPAGADRIPLAPTLTASGGLAIRDTGPVEAWLRARHVGSRPADEADRLRADGSTVLDAGAAWRSGRLELRLAVENLLDVEWNEAQFATTSRLRGEAAPVTEIHFTPGARRGVSLGVGYGL